MLRPPERELRLHPQAVASYYCIAWMKVSEAGRRSAAGGPAAIGEAQAAAPCVWTQRPAEGMRPIRRVLAAGPWQASSLSWGGDVA